MADGAHRIPTRRCRHAAAMVKVLTYNLTSLMHADYYKKFISILTKMLTSSIPLRPLATAPPSLHTPNTHTPTHEHTPTVTHSHQSPHHTLSQPTPRAWGWMPNYLRHVVAGFLIEYLGLDWRHGEAWFHDTLVDADVAINAFMWQNGGHSGASPIPNPDQWAPTNGSSCSP